jgi:hypothetical protein
MLDGIQKKCKRRNTHVGYSAGCLEFSGGSKNNKIACCRFPETNQTKMPKCVDLTKGTKWQWFISFDAGFGFAIF